MVVLDSDGRLSDQQLFSQLGWVRGTRVDIGVGDGHEIVVRRDEEGAWALTSRNMVLVPAPLRRWCGYGAGGPVLVVAVPPMSAVVLHNLETLDQALPDPRRIVERMRPAGARPGLEVPTTADTTGDGNDGELSSGRGSHAATGPRARQVRVMAVSSTQADVQALVQMMQHLNVEPEELVAAARPQNIPTFEQFMPLVRAATSPATQITLRAYWNTIVTCWSTRRLHELTPRDVEELYEHVRAIAQRRHNHADGVGAVHHTYYALQRVYRLAMEQGILSSRQNLMARVPNGRLLVEREAERSARRPDRGTSVRCGRSHLGEFSGIPRRGQMPSEASGDPMLEPLDEHRRLG
ncbi:hypothetical protein GCM10022267_89100 [Lentzea roselyniae]|uniref:Uncharacterized protein n=1 Tax=Lentzea roselyniae TaxID=531940 RepID=A0ABP7CIZ3_9PSEU